MLKFHFFWNRNFELNLSAKFNLYNTPVKVIYNGVSIQHNQFEDLSKKKYVLTLANLSERKGHKEYLKVIQSIVKEFPNVQFLFLGYDNLNGQIQKLIIDMNLEANVKYLGFQENVGDFQNVLIKFWKFPALS